MNCVLCESPQIKEGAPLLDGKAYFHCSQCDLRFLNPSQRLTGIEERDRYTLHQTKEGDVGYRRFVADLLDRLGVLLPQPSSVYGLDFGAGHQPVLAEHLRALGYHVDIYDPFFWPNTDHLKRSYDFLVACEVVEHFFSPAEEFARMRERLRDGGVLLINTEIYRETINFEDWYYRRDPTHVSFYSEATFKWIARHLGFAELWTRGRVVSLRRLQDKV